jgi:uncharacterized integral membrane protein
MIRLMLAVLATVVLVAFSMANAHRVELSLIFGRPAEIRLITLLAATWGAGLLTGVLWGMFRRVQQAERVSPRLTSATMDSEGKD